MAAESSAQTWDRPSRRRGVRYRVQAPLDVTVLRSGIPDTLPGRSMDLGEGGVSAVLAGELSPGEAVGVEIRLPQRTDPLRTRARVRHHDKLRAGMEFVGLSVEQQSAIRELAGMAKASPEAMVTQTKATTAASGKGSEGGGRSETESPLERRRRRKAWALFLLSIVILLTVLWWRWNRGWEEIESRLRTGDPTAETQPQIKVPAEVMEKLVRHRVDPDYPAAARPTRLQGVIVLDVTVGRDGSVVDVRARNGPEVLARPAMDAMRWWKFEPYRVDGQPVIVETTMAMEFKL